MTTQATRFKVHHRDLGRVLRRQYKQVPHSLSGQAWVRTLEVAVLSGLELRPVYVQMSFVASTPPSCRRTPAG